MKNYTPHYDSITIGNLNRRYANELGWKSRYNQIKYILRINTTLPEPMEFALALADWQSQTHSLKVDGLLGPITWKKMRPLTRFNAPTLSILPPWLRMNSYIRVKFKVPMVSQGNDPICWMASAAMILSWKAQRLVTLQSMPEYTTYSTSSPASGGPGKIKILENLGFAKAYYEIGMVSEKDLLSYLNAFGPLLAFIEVARLYVFDRTIGDHAVVITGLDTAKDICFINNPWGGIDEERDVHLVLDTLDEWQKLHGASAMTLMYLT